MTQFEEILSKLKDGANFELKFENGYYSGFGAINRFEECKIENNPDPFWYNNVHYPKKKKILESLPWNVVKNPRLPEKGEYPSEAGEYITMLDCDEHYVLINTYDGQNWSLYNNTHVKWWMSLPDMSQIEKLLDSIYNGNEKNIRR